LFFAVSINLASRIVVDNKQLKLFIGKRHHFKTSYVPYGISQPKPQSWDETKLSSCVHEDTASGKIIEGKYWLLVARLEPENNIHVIVDGFVKARPNYPLVIVGDFTSDRYRDRVYKLAFNGNSPNVFFLGAIYDADLLWMLRQHCFAYLHGHSVGGTNPSLLEAMVSKNIILAHDNPFNRELCGKFAYYFTNGTDLSGLITLVEQSPGPAEFRSEVYKRAVEAYSWDHVIALYEKIFVATTAKR